MTFEGELFPFQAEAAEMMLSRQKLLLTHEMGLGKTVTTIATIEHLIDTGKVKSALVIAPASVKWQWKRQLDKFTDGALVRVVEGDKLHRQMIYRAIKRGEIEYAIANYEQIVGDWGVIRHLAFDAVVCDEVVAIKNPTAKRSRYVKRLAAPYRFGLTGQPIENKPEELYSIMQWVDPEVLGPPHIFERTFIVRNDWGKVQFYKHLDLLKERMGTAMHRRTRSEIADQFPAVVEKDYVVEFARPEEKLYRYIARDLLKEIEAAGPSFSTFSVEQHYRGDDLSMAAYGRIMPRLIALRMLCDHPDLLRFSADQFEDPETQAGSHYAAELKMAGHLEGVKDSPKMTATLGAIREILEADPKNKVVVFSFFKPMLGLLSQKLKVGSWELFTGELSARQRDTALERFRNNASCRVLLSSDAGGIGVDLPQANYLISYDLPWSAGKFAQRNGRILRISSEWPEVTLLTMLVKDSIEERMLDMLFEKAKVAAAWLDGEGVDVTGVFEPTLGTLADFLEERVAP